MQIFVVGMNHKSAPVELRERFTFSAPATDQALGNLRKSPAFCESLLLSTCNRTEIYGVSEIAQDYATWAARMLETEKGIPARDFGHCLYAWSGPDAVEHLFKVVCGLDSMVIGETEVLGQVKRAYEKASTAKNTGKILHRLFQQSFHVAKAVRTLYGTCCAGASVSSMTVELARKIFNDLESCRVMIVGAGETGELTLKHLLKAGVRSIVASNRSYDRACEMAHHYGGEAITLENALENMVDMDIVISSTAAPHILFTRDQVERLMSKRQNKPLFFIDIAVPRDIDPGVNDLENVFLYNIDDLQRLSEERSRQLEVYVQQSRDRISKERQKFFAWFPALGGTPKIKSPGESWEREPVRLQEL